MVVVFYTSFAMIGGFEARISRMAGELQRRGHKCVLLFRRGGDLLPSIPAGVEVVLGGLVDLMRLVTRLGADVVHAPTYQYEDALPAVRGTGCKLVMGHVIADRRGHFWDSRSCDGVVAVSRAAGDDIEPFTDLPVQVIYNGVDIERFSPVRGVVQGPPIVAWVGRASDLKQKRIDRLAAVAPHLVAAGCRLWVASPRALDDVDTGAAEILGRLVERWQSVPAHDMPAFYQQVAASGGCLLHTADCEGLPNSLLESQACGCPVIGTDAPGVNEAVRPEGGGELYPPDEAAETVAERLLHLVGDPAERTRRADAAVDFMREHFSFVGMVDQYLQAFATAPYQPVRSRPYQPAWAPLAPLLHQHDYVTERWPLGHQCYEAAVQLQGSGDGRAARAALREAWRCGPTLFVRPRRLIAAGRILRRRVPEMDH